MEEQVFDIKSGLFNTVRELKINKNFLSFNGTKILKNEIEGYRYGMQWISLDVTFGREYIIYIRTKDKKSLKINFRTFFGRKVSHYHQLYAEIVDAMWYYYSEDVIRNYLDMYTNGETFIINFLTFSPQGLTIKRHILKDLFIPWEKVRTNNYYTNFSIHSIEDPANINMTSSYFEDWNTTILFSVVRGILKHEQIETYDS